MEITKLAAADLPEAAAVLAEGMRDNPLHVAVFGPCPERRQRRLLRLLRQLIAYVHANGEVLGAFSCGELVGVLGMIEPGRCRPPPIAALRLAGAILPRNSPKAVLRIRRWLTAWRRNDPVGRHWHIGPFAVRPEYRRGGIGRRLMSVCCRRMDVLAEVAYLETDLAINVAFYETLGFVVTRREPVLGVPNWFMSRAPRPQHHEVS